MNHRDIIGSASKRARFNFLKIPIELQDAIMSGLENRSLTLLQASELARKEGYRLSAQAIANYCRGVRRQQRELIAESIARRGKD